MNALVVVESPAKAKTINKYLGKDYRVLASYGHVRDLPAKDGSVDPEHDFAMKWQVDAKSRKHVNEIAKALAESERLILATDPDREGEAISWHVLEILKEKGVLKDKDVQRVVFHAITPAAIAEAMKNPRDIDRHLVEAYLARRALDYLVGFTLSPVLWRKLPGARSAGRVQSVALRLVAERELEIETFTPQEYWTISVALETPEGAHLPARLFARDGKKLDKLAIASESEADALRQALEQARCRVEKVEQKPVRRNPPPPFTTSTLQQEASRKLGFSPARTMQLAQRLYEGVDIGGETVGLITYMRTDAVNMAPEGIEAARRAIQERFGETYLPEKPRTYRNKVRNAQEAHEAIRPTDPTRTPEDVAPYLDKDLLRLYDLIWKRTLASQMPSAEFMRTTVDIRAEGTDGHVYTLRATGQVQTFDGFLKLYQEGRDDEEEGEDSRLLPAVKEGEALTPVKVEAKQHFTEPPPRYTEASLVKKLEELGIGRPSTYASILQILKDRGYVRLERKRLVPEDRGVLVTAFLESFFPRYVQYDFTASLEEKLDRIARGEENWKDLLRQFWTEFRETVEKASALKISEVLEALNDILGPYIFPRSADGKPDRTCPACKSGTLSLKIGRYGAFIGCSNYPECTYTRPLSGGAQEGEAAAAPAEGVLLGHDPETGLPVTRHQGRFGPYVQLGEAGENGEKPKRATIPKGLDPESVDLEMALKLLSLPREVGRHPETGEPILAGIGRYGPYVQHGRTYANLPSVEDVFTIGINRAVDLIAQKQAKGSRQVIKTLGEHPDGGEIQVLTGRYGPYVKWKRINATLPKDIAPEDVTLEQALELIAAKQASKSKKSSRKSTTKG
ncbi:type I DNA topoisomerase [Thermopetrobacter sp. TC1]|uniref:type I DNA topoisomerase n=1 Tax=Thermopetrobacter sp. TC1 TaxID=1495045 RepID=UPI000691E845|nr:type I DNA topoisomerase [Thermopetrobacter sp. TC1]